tara:strand:+ start:3029 stop:3676 length:648 start_codon:yes stop_codon:yes gene_type:complete
MNENVFDDKNNLEKKSKVKQFYDKNKIIIFSIIIVIISFLIYLNFYIENKKKKQITLSDNYINAKIYLENGEEEKAKEILKNIIISKNDTYATLALFLILDKKLFKDENEVIDLFDNVLKNNKFDEDIKNLLIFKKAIFQSNFVSENQLLESLKPLMKKETVWKPHALLLLGDFYLSKGEKNKAKEFYNELLSLKDLDNEFYKRASMQMEFTNDD